MTKTLAAALHEAGIGCWHNMVDKNVDPLHSHEEEAAALLATGVVVVTEEELAEALDTHFHHPPGDWPCDKQQCSAAIFAALAKQQEEET